LRIKCWGARGSIPVCGKQYLKYGGSTTCLEIRTDNDELLIVDAGTGIRQLGNVLIHEKRNNFNLLFTHAHMDHLWGLPFFKPIYKQGVYINVYGCPFAQKSTREILMSSMAPPFFPIPFEDLKAEMLYLSSCEEPFQLDSLEIIPIPISHPNRGLGYKFIENGRVFVFLTDNELTYQHPQGLTYDQYLKFVAGADLLIHDAEFTPKEYKLTKGWGHSVYLDALQLALEGEVKQFGLFHHNQEREDKDLDGMVEHCRQIIKEKGSPLKCLAVAEGKEFNL
jgi:phosphoribosyl 1,2-cyclic phosphodiesterase